jgi:hypothetical protein
MKKILRIIEALKLKKPLEIIFSLEASIASIWVSSAYGRLKKVMYGLPPYPDYFDHRIDLYSQWLKTGNSMWLERGIFNKLALKRGGGRFGALLRGWL